jgi:hypothetical protein
VQPSVQYKIADLQLHIKGTNNPSQNSDIDAEVRLWNIWHFRGDYTSQIVDLQPSDRIWVGSQFENIEQLHGANSTFSIPPTAPYPPLSSTGTPEGGHWLHVEQPIPFHFYASQFYATLADTITIGIEHVPEPTTAALLGLAAVCTIMGVRSYRKRNLAS